MPDVIQENSAEITPEPLQEPVCRTSVRIGKELIERTGKPLRIILLVMLIVGAVGLVAWIAASATLESLYERGAYSGDYSLAESILNPLLWITTVLFTFGLIFSISLRLNAKKEFKVERENVYAFYERYFTVTDMREGEDLGTVKTYYADLARTRETKEFFLLYPNNATFFPVDKKLLKEEEIAALRCVLPLKKK